MYLFFPINGLSSRAVIGQEPVIIHKSVYGDKTSLHDHAVSKRDRKFGINMYPTTSIRHVGTPSSRFTKLKIVHFSRTCTFFIFIRLGGGETAMAMLFRTVNLQATLPNPSDRYPTRIEAKHSGPTKTVMISLTARFAKRKLVVV